MSDKKGKTFFLDEKGVKDAYERWAKVYDIVFGSVSGPARRRAIKAVNSLPGTDVLEVGVGTGLALPHYNLEKNVTGIDLSSHMLEKARARVDRLNLTNIFEIKEIDAEHTDFPDNSFDIAVGMFVASVVPNPDKLFKELTRVVRPNGYILFINHFNARNGLRLFAEKKLARASRALGWHPDFPIEKLFPQEVLPKVHFSSVPPFGLFSLAILKNEKS
ncbi:class I SAM-dependent methyltransferase [Acetobacteraceae bacterium]|nr:class I SAM-dependent methyltransferase [Acetobacteraceae bacterium]